MIAEVAERRDRRRGAVRDAEQRLLDENQELRATVQAMATRITELERLADSDTLTPLPNRRFFERELERTMGRVARYGTSAALLFVDLNKLKAINDFHGHAAGDMALVHVARLLRASVRGMDVVARIGGDEFGIILDNLDEQAAREKADALMEVIRAHPLGNGLVLSVSIGVTALVPSDERGEAALSRADGDMYRVKRQG